MLSTRLGRAANDGGRARIGRDRARARRSRRSLTGRVDPEIAFLTCHTSILDGGSTRTDE